MTIFGYHASHEQFTPSELLHWTQTAVDNGFGAVMCSDHIEPWSEDQGQSGFAFAWLGAAMQSTTVTFGSVCAPGQRYHPAIVAQAAATLAEMFPERYWIALGSGQLLNEHITGDPWPRKEARNERVRECADVIRRLWTGERVSYKGHISVDEARIYTLPDKAPLLMGAAITASTAEWLGGWADGMITIAQPRDQLKEVIARFRKGGGVDKPIFLQAQHSYAQSEVEALDGAHNQWRNTVFASKVATDIKTPKQFDAVGQFVQPEDMRKYVRVSADLDKHIEWLKEDEEMGFDRVYIHNVNRKQEQFIQMFGKHVLPALMT